MVHLRFSLISVWHNSNNGLGSVGTCGVKWIRAREGVVVVQTSHTLFCCDNLLNANKAVLSKQNNTNWLGGKHFRIFFYQPSNCGGLIGELFCLNPHTGSRSLRNNTPKMLCLCQLCFERVVCCFFLSCVCLYFSFRVRVLHLPVPHAPSPSPFPLSDDSRTKFVLYTGRKR